MNPVVRTDRLTKHFGDFTAVDRISFEVPAGEVVGFLGPNGSGKTTTIRMLLGLLQPSSGDAEVMGFDIRKNPEEIRQRVGYVSQKFALYHDLTVIENLQFYAGVYGVADPARIRDILNLVGIEQFDRTLVAGLSTGWQQRLALATAIVHRPKLFFLDEPTSGLHFDDVRKLLSVLQKFVESGNTVLVIEHNLDVIKNADHIIDLGPEGGDEGGEVIVTGTPEEVAKHRRSHTGAYLQKTLSLHP